MQRSIVCMCRCNELIKKKKKKKKKYVKLSFGKFRHYLSLKTNGQQLKTFYCQAELDILHLTPLFNLIQGKITLLESDHDIIAISGQ